eukprot:181966_1
MDLILHRTSKQYIVLICHGCRIHDVKIINLHQKSLLPLNFSFFRIMQYDDNKRQKQCKLLLQMLDQQKLADTTFIIGSNQEEYNVNRVFLAMISPVFEAMLFGHMKESEPNSDVIIEDIDPTIFECVLNFAYCNDPKISDDNVVALYQVADKYQMQILLEWCDEYFRSSLSVENVCTFLEQSIRSNQTQLMRKCQTAIQNYSATKLQDVLCSDGFRNLTVKVMREFLNNICCDIVEDTLWKYVVKWADYNSKKKINLIQNDINADDEKYSENINDKTELLKSVYDLIRFGLMNGKYFCTNVLSENVLSKDEMLSVLIYYQNKEAGCGKFVTEKRL